MPNPKIQKVLGQDVIVIKNQLMALYMNLWAWFVSTLASFGITFLQTVHEVPPAGSNCAVSIQGPGGLDQVCISACLCVSLCVSVCLRVSHSH